MKEKSSMVPLLALLIKKNLYIYRFIWYTNKRVLNINHCGFWRHFSNVHWFPLVSISLTNTLSLPPHFFCLLFYAEQTNIEIGIVEAFSAYAFHNIKQVLIFMFRLYRKFVWIQWKKRERKNWKTKLNIKFNKLFDVCWWVNTCGTLLKSTIFKWQKKRQKTFVQCCKNMKND